MGSRLPPRFKIRQGPFIGLIHVFFALLLQKDLALRRQIQYRFPMNQDLFDWLLLLARWLHITVAMAWIGTSIFFMWLDRSLENGELWMVHGGGFYQVRKLMMGTTKVPEHLHWFKWESYWTWMSGLFLVTMIFYVGHGTFLLDSSVSGITYWQGVGLAISALVISWLFYDFLWESELTKKRPLIGHALTLLWLAGMAYLLCHTLSGRAAYIHIGGMLGTWMTANVFLRIIPRQTKMVEAAQKNEPINQEWPKNAKNRSTHNTYFTLPVIFIMLSNHFPSTYGNEFNWLILLLMCAGGAAIREFFVTRIQKQTRARTFLAAGLVLIGIAGILTSQPSLSTSETTPVLVTTESPKGPTGHLAGKISWEGALPATTRLELPQGCTKKKDALYSNEILINNGHVKNVFVHITKGLGGKSFGAIPENSVKLDQHDCLYDPRTIAVRVGQKVEFINSDVVFHNVRSVTEKNESFNIAMPSQNDRLVKTFNTPEILQSKCSVHPWMSANIAVVEHPYFDVTGDNGEFQIRDIPVGSYTLEIWHEVFGTQSKEFVVEANKTVQLDFIYRK